MTGRAVAIGQTAHPRRDTTRSPNPAGRRGIGGYTRVGSRSAPCSAYEPFFKRAANVLSGSAVADSAFERTFPARCSI
jgi:hypothetical protein